MQPFADVLELIRTLARAAAHHVLIVLGCAAVFLAGAVVLLAVRDPQYTATMTVAMTTADLTGRLVAPDTNAKTRSYRIVRALTEEGLLPYLHLLQSYEVAELLIVHAHFERTLFAADVDPQNGRWKPRSSLSIGGPRGERPTADDVQRALKRMLLVNLPAEPGLATVRCVSSSQTLCVALLNAVHREAQFHLRTMRLDAALHARDFLKRTNPPDPDMRTALAAKLAALDNEILTLRAEAPIGAVVIEPPFVPAGPSYPRPVLILLVALSMGLGVGVVLAWAIEDRTSRPPP